MEEIPALVSDLPMYAGDGLSCPTGWPRAVRPGGHPPLGSRKTPGGRTEVPRILNHRAVGGRCHGGNPAIDTNSSAGGGEGLRWHIGAEHRDPPSPALTTQSAGLRDASKWAMDPDLYVPYAVDIETASVGIEAPARDVAPLHRIPAALTSEPRESDPLPSGAPSVEALERLIETRQSATAHRDAPDQNIRSDRSEFRQSPVLLVAGYPPPFPPPRPSALLQRRVV